MPQASKPTLRSAAVRRPLPAPTSKQKGLVGVREIPSLLNDHSADARPPQVAKFAPGGLASDDEVDELVLEDVGGELEAALTSTTPAPDGSRPEGGAGVAACNDDAVGLECEDVVAVKTDQLTATAQHCG